MEAQSILDTLKEKYLGKEVVVYRDIAGDFSLQNQIVNYSTLNVKVIDLIKNIQGFFICFDYRGTKTYLRLNNK